MEPAIDVLGVKSAQRASRALGEPELAARAPDVVFVGRRACVPGELLESAHARASRSSQSA